MANYPTSLDNFTNPTAVDSLNTPSHSLQHADANDAIEALEAKLGIGNSPAGSATAGHVLVAQTAGTTSWTTVGASAISTTGGTAGQYLSAGTAGVAQWASVPEPGMTLIAVQSPSAASNIAFTDVFNSTYTHYRLVFSGVGSTTSYFNMRVRNSTTDYTGSQYKYAEWKATSGATTGFSHNSTATTSFGICYWNGGSFPSMYSIDIIPSGLYLSYAGTGHSTTNNGESAITSGEVLSTATITGINLLVNSGTFTGSMALYGYRKAL